jgi:hypothetical protein
MRWFNFYASPGNDKKGKPLSLSWKVKLLNQSNDPSSKKDEKEFKLNPVRNN